MLELSFPLFLSWLAKLLRKCKWALRRMARQPTAVPVAEKKSPSSVRGNDISAGRPRRPRSTFEDHSWETRNGIKSRRRRTTRRWQAPFERRRFSTSLAERGPGQAGHRQNDASARKEYAEICGPRACGVECVIVAAAWCSVHSD